MQRKKKRFTRIAAISLTAALAMSMSFPAFAYQGKTDIRDNHQSIITTSVLPTGAKTSQSTSGTAVKTSQSTSGIAAKTSQSTTETAVKTAMSTTKTTAVETYTPSTATEKDYDVAIRLVAITDEGESVLQTQYGKYGDSFGPQGTLVVRDTYYDQSTKSDYDLLTAKGESTKQTDSSAFSGTLTAGQKTIPSSATLATNSDGKPELTFYYVKHAEDERTITLNAVTPEGTVLKSIQKTITQDTDVEAAKELGEKFTENGLVYVAPSEMYTMLFTGDTVQNITYAVAGSIESEGYYITVKYVDSDSKQVLASRQVFVKSNDKAKKYIAPRTLAITNDGKTTYYKVDQNKKDNSYEFTHKKDSTKREYTVYYINDVKNRQDYTWYILQYDAATNQCIHIIQRTVKYGETVEFNAKKEDLPKGYTVNQSFNKVLKHTYGDGERSTYVYYDPEGYNTKTVHKKDVTFRYMVIDDTVNGHEIFPEETDLIKTHMEVTDQKPDSADDQDRDTVAETEYKLPERISYKGEEYELVKGQVNPVLLSYYSPRSTYTFYYKNVKDVNFYTIKTEIIHEAEILDGHITYVIVPGVTRTIITQVGTGISRPVQVNDNTGAEIGNNGDANANGANGGDANGGDANGGTDTSIDGIDTDEIQTPQANIKLDKKNENNFPVVPIVMAVAVAGLLLMASGLMIRRKKLQFVNKGQSYDPSKEDQGTEATNQEDKKGGNQ